MSHEWICSCLQLPPDSWPPDHYTLLGLELGEVDSRQIEQRAQDRMEKLRPYQLTHTDQATEAMNRLAQALVCLTDPAARHAYDAFLLSRQVHRPAQPSAHPSSRRRRQPDPAEVSSYSRPFPRWLLIAWMLWLAVGAAGFVALAQNFSLIEQSLHGDHGAIGSRLRPLAPRARP